MTTDGDLPNLSRNEKCIELLQLLSFCEFRQIDRYKDSNVFLDFEFCRKYWFKFYMLNFNQQICGIIYI